MKQKYILANHDGDINENVTKNRFNKQNMILQRAFGIFVHFIRRLQNSTRWTWIPKGPVKVL